MWWHLISFLTFAQNPRMGVVIHAEELLEIDALQSVVEQKSVEILGSEHQIQFAWNEALTLAQLEVPPQCTPKTCTLLKAAMMGWTHAMVISVRKKQSGWLFRVTIFEVRSEEILSSQHMYIHEGRAALQHYEAMLGLAKRELAWEKASSQSETDAPEDIIVDVQQIDGAIVVEDGLGILSCLIPSGTYKKACSDCIDGYTPESIPRSFFMMQHEVSQSLYEEITQKKPSQFFRCGGDCPVERVSWYDALQFANALSTKQGLESCYSFSGSSVVEKEDCTGWRLPSKTVWSYAAQGGQEPPYRFGASDAVDENAWYVGNSAKRTHRACQKKQNAYGLCDMSGNVWEWGWDTRNKKEMFGGSWGNQAEKTEINASVALPPTTRNYAVGFRLMRWR